MASQYSPALRQPVIDPLDLLRWGTRHPLSTLIRIFRTLPIVTLRRKLPLGKTQNVYERKEISKNLENMVNRAGNKGRNNLTVQLQYKDYAVLPKNNHLD